LDDDRGTVVGAEPLQVAMELKESGMDEGTELELDTEVMPMGRYWWLL